MNVKPKRYLGGEMQAHSVPPLFYLECEVTSPPSRVGQSVTLVLDVEDSTKLLLELRDHGRSVRS